MTDEQTAAAEKKEAEAKKAAEKRAAWNKKNLVTMEKDGAELAVHPDCVAAHEKAGWRIQEKG